MRRKTFQIIKNDVVISTRYSWNSARAEIRRLVREYLFDGETAFLFCENSERDENNQHVEGSQTWHTSGGRAIYYEIRKVF